MPEQAAVAERICHLPEVVCPHCDAKHTHTTKLEVGAMFYCPSCKEVIHVVFATTKATLSTRPRPANPEAH